MSKVPVVSVIIPTYNRAHLLERAVMSVLNQTYQDLELLVVDDASTDDTMGVISKINDSRIRYIRHAVNKGGSAARNTGIKESRGRFIAFQDSDDEWLWDKLKKQIEVFDACDDKVGVVYTGYLLWEGQSAVYIPQSQVKVKDGDVLSQILVENIVGTPTLLVRKKCLERAGHFDEGLPRFQDWELVIRLAKVCQFRLIDHPMVIAYSTPGNVSSNKTAGLSALETLLKKHSSLFCDYPKEQAKLLKEVGHLKCMYENTTDGREYFIKSVKVNPWNIKIYFSWLLSLFGKNLYVANKRFCHFLSETLKNV
ncbi:MAG: glycosyltransferase [Pseudomonadota bacterium]